MKTHIINLSLLPALIAGLGPMLAHRVTAQTFTTLYSFTALDPVTGINGDGARPLAGLILSGSTLYGTAINGGDWGRGTVFAVNTDGTGFANLHSLDGSSDGSGLYAGLILSGNTLYGTASGGGSSSDGTVFAVNTDGTGFTTLHSFTGSEGAIPYADLISSQDTLYGNSREGGSSGHGTVFSINADGTGFRNLHSFGATTYDSSSSYYTNREGCCPIARLILSGKTLYGTAPGGGSPGSGIVFAVNTDGTGFTNLHTFTALSAPSYSGVNIDGAFPRASLILLGDTLYGTAYFGGRSGHGTVFKVNTNGTDFTNLHNFTATSGPSATNSDGTYPAADLVLWGNTLYGTASEGGSSGSGTVFAVNSDGTGFTTLHSFTAASCCPGTNGDGGVPNAGLILSGGTLYGTASHGGASGKGTVFSLSLPAPPPHLTLVSDGNGGYFIRVQGTPSLTYGLQRAPSVAGPWSAIVTNTAPTSGLIEYHETIPPSDRAFYRTLQQ